MDLVPTNAFPSSETQYYPENEPKSETFVELSKHRFCAAADAKSTIMQQHRSPKYSNGINKKNN
jgi:hypothetical protein